MNIKEFISYDPRTGEFIWKKSPARNVPQGSKARSISSDGYRRFGFLGKSYLAHRVAWLLMTGKWPAQLIDHINGDRLDNRWCNLREATPSENQMNRGRNAHRLYDLPKGVCFNRRIGLYTVIIGANRIKKYIGCFKDVESARVAYENAAAELHREFARVA